jgi:hypothetical protein
MPARHARPGADLVVSRGSNVLRTLLFPLIVLSLLATHSAAQIKSVRDTARARVRSEPGPPTAREAERFGLAFEEAIRVRDVVEAESHVDWSAIQAKATNGIPAYEKVRNEFRAAADEDLRGKSGLVSGTIATVEAGGTCRFLRVVERGGDVRALFRIAHADGGMPEYVAFVLETDDEGAAVAVDVDVVSDGGLVSARLRRYFMGLAAGATKNLAEKLRGADKVRASHLKDLEAVEDGFREGQNAQALEKLKMLPQEMRDAVDVVLLNLNVARSVSDEAFRAALGDARARLPHNASVELIALDHFVLTNAHDEAHRALKEVALAIGGDPYLDWIDATIFEAAGDMESARAACTRAVTADPMLEDAWWTLLSLAVRVERYTEAASILEKMASRFEIDWNAFDLAPAYEDFLASVPGRAWHAKRTAR